MRLIVGITGATGVIYGVRLLERLREAGVETHLVVSRWGARTLTHETPYSREQVEALAHTSYAPADMGAAISSGSFQTAGMAIVPCSAKTVAAIAHGFGDSLIHRAAHAGLLQQSTLAHRHRGPHGGAHARSIRHRGAGRRAAVDRGNESGRAY